MLLLSDLNHGIGGQDQPIPLLSVIRALPADFGQIACICDNALNVATVQATIEGGTRHLGGSVELTTMKEAFTQRSLDQRQILLDRRSPAFLCVVESFSRMAVAPSKRPLLLRTSHEMHPASARLGCRVLLLPEQPAAAANLRARTTAPPRVILARTY
jgi:hypothetical protein